MEKKFVRDCRKVGIPAHSGSIDSHSDKNSSYQRFGTLTAERIVIVLHSHGWSLLRRSELVVGSHPTRWSENSSRTDNLLFVCVFIVIVSLIFYSY